MPIRDGSPPAPARSRDDSEEEDEDDDHVHQMARANGKRNAGDGSNIDPKSSNGGDAIPPLTCWAPAMFVPAKFDYTQPQQSAEEQEQLPPHQRLNNLLADLDAHAAAVRANHAWMVGRETRRIQQDTVREEARIIGNGEPLPRSRRLAPSAAEEAFLLRNMAAVPAELQQQPQRRQSNPNTIPAFRRSSYDRSNSNSSSNNVAGGAAADPAATANVVSNYEVPMNFSYRSVSALPVDQRDTPREAAVTSVLNVARNAMHNADWYSSICQKRRNDKIRDHANAKAKSFGQRDTTASSGNQNTTKSMITSSSATMAKPTSTSTNISGDPSRRVSFGGLDGTADSGDDGGDMLMDLD